MVAHQAGSDQSVNRGYIMAKRDLSVSTIRECLEYNPDTGEFTRAKRTAQCHQVGDRADLPAYGALAGYLTIGLQGDKHLAHRVAWAHFYGEWPKQHIDHINRNKSDNRIVNLRDVANITNMQNKFQVLCTKASTNLVGAYQYGAKWRARIQVGEKSIHLGMFDTDTDAHAAYVAAKKIYHEGFAQ